MTHDCASAGNALVLANAALTRGNYARAIRLYAGILIGQPALRDQVGFNLLLARRRYRAERRGQLPRVGVCGSNLAGDGGWRAGELADIYRGLVPTEIIGSLFSEAEEDLCPSIRDHVRPGQFFRVESDSRYPAQAMELVRNNPYDIVHLCGRRFPGIVIGLLYKQLWDAHVIVDIDDDKEELALIDAGDEVDFEGWLQTHHCSAALQSVPDEQWARLGAGLWDIFDGHTTSNLALQRRHGGILVPHARDAAELLPSSGRSAASRARFGVPVDKTVALFFGRASKVLLSAARAIGKIGRDDLWLIVADERPGGKLADDLDALPGVHLHFLGIPSRAVIPDIVAMGDIYLLLPEEDSLVAKYAVPPQLTDALARGIVTFALPGAPLADFIAHEAIVPTGMRDLQKAIRTHLQSREEMSRVRQAARSYFLARLSTDACQDVLKREVLEKVASPAPAPGGLSAHRQQRLFEALGGWDGFADRRIVVYSVLVGDYDEVKDPAFIDSAARYILFTDRPGLTSSKWEVVRFDTMGLDPRRASRLPKMLPHRYLPDHDVSIYIDASLTMIERDVVAMVRNCLHGRDIAAYPHYRRDCLYKEVADCVRLGKVDETRAGPFLERLAREKFPKELGLLENAFLVRRDTPVTRRINELWLGEYLAGAERDQFYLMYVLWRAEVPHSVIANSGNFRKSPHVLFTDHPKPSTAPASAPGQPPAPGQPQDRGIQKDRDPARLKASCDRLLASAPDSETLLAAKTAVDGEQDASPIEALISCIVDLEYQRQTAGQHYRSQLSSRLFSLRPHVSLEPGRTRIACIARSPMPAFHADNLNMTATCSALTGLGADIVLYAERAVDGAGPGEPDAFAVADRFPVRFGDGIAFGSAFACYRLVRQAIDDSCTHVLTQRLDAAVFSVAADIPTVLELREPVEPHDFDKLEFVARSPALEMLIVTSESLVDRFKGILRGLEEKTIVLRNGCEAVVEELPAFKLARSQGAVAHIGYIDDRHRPATDADMAFDLARRMPQVDFHLIGDTGHLDVWKARAAGLPNVQVYGPCPSGEVASFIQEIDAIIAPYGGIRDAGDGRLRDTYLFPTEIFQAMARGKAIVASNLAILREVLDHRRTALLCDADDFEAFAAAVQDLVSYPDLRRSLGVAARETLVASCTWEVRARRLLDRIEKRPQLVSGSGTRPPVRPAIHTGSKPLVCWYRGGSSQEGWAYGINARRLSSRIPSLDHLVDATGNTATKSADVVIAFDILILDRITSANPGARKTILRVGGPNPLKVFAGGNIEKLSRALQGVDAIIALSPQLQVSLKELHPNVCFIPNGIDTKFFHPARRTRDDDGEFTVGLSASLTKVEERHSKGYYLAKEACERAGVELLVVGRGINQIPHDRLIEDFYSRIDVLVHPVSAGKEGSSNVIMEALALGIPVVTTRYAGFHGAAMRNGEEGLVVRRTAGDFTAAILALKDDANLRARLRRGGRAFVESHHSLELIARQYEDVIWSCLGTYPGDDTGETTVMLEAWGLSH